MISLLSEQGTLKSSPAPQFKSISSWMLSLLFGLTLTSIHDYWINHTFDYTDLCWQKRMSLLFNTLFRFVIAFLPRSKCILISWLPRHLQWFWSPRKWSLSLFTLFPHLIAVKWWDRMPWFYWKAIKPLKEQLNRTSCSFICHQTLRFTFIK